jgi:hypothetical protein
MNKDAGGGRQRLGGGTVRAHTTGCWIGESLYDPHRISRDLMKGWYGQNLGSEQRARVNWSEWAGTAKNDKIESFPYQKTRPQFGKVAVGAKNCLPPR